MQSLEKLLLEQIVGGPQDGRKLSSYTAPVVDVEGSASIGLVGQTLGEIRGKLSMGEEGRLPRR
jgi:hypothetical protein